VLLQVYIEKKRNNWLVIYKNKNRPTNIFKKDFWRRYYWELTCTDPRVGYKEGCGFAITLKQAINDCDNYIFKNKFGDIK